MRLLLDQNLSFRLVDRLKQEFQEVAHIKGLALENASDREIWEFAKLNDYAIVTFDADFYDFSIVWGHPPKVIWVRSFDQTTQNIESLLIRHKAQLAAFIDSSELSCLQLQDI